MKINNRPKSNKRPLIIAGAILVAVALGIGGYFLYQYLTSNPSDSGTPALDKPATQEEIDTGAQIKQENADKDAAGGSDQSTDPGDLEISFNGPNQNGSLIQVRIIIANLVSNDGTCTATFTKGSQTVTKSAGLQALPSSSTCEGFDVSTSELPAGTWKLTTVVNSGSRKGSATTTFEVN